MATRKKDEVKDWRVPIPLKLLQLSPKSDQRDSDSVQDVNVAFENLNSLMDVPMYCGGCNLRAHPKTHCGVKFYNLLTICCMTIGWACLTINQSERVGLKREEEKEEGLEAHFSFFPKTQATEKETYPWLSLRA